MTAPTLRFPLELEGIGELLDPPRLLMDDAGDRDEQAPIGFRQAIDERGRSGFRTIAVSIVGLAPDQPVSRQPRQDLLAFRLTDIEPLRDRRRIPPTVWLGAEQQQR